jgi:hypothetical protein
MDVEEVETYYQLDAMDDAMGMILTYMEGDTVVFKLSV